MLPQGLFSVAVSTVLFPELSRAAAVRNMVELARIVARGIRAIVFLLLPAAAISIVLAEPVVRLLYQHGQFNESDTVRVSATLVMFSLGLLGNGLSLLLTRAFFGLQEPRIPTLVALVNLVLNLFLDLALLRYGAAGIALATAIVTSFNAGVLMVLLRRRVGSLHGREVLRAAALTAVATIYCTVAAFGVWYPTGQAPGPLDRRLRSCPSAWGWPPAASPTWSRPVRCIWPRWTSSPASCTAAAIPQRDAPVRLTRGALAHPQLLDHRPHRPRQVDAGRSHPAGHQDSGRP